MGDRGLLAALIFATGALGGCQTADVGALPPPGRVLAPQSRMVAERAGLPQAGGLLAGFGQAPTPIGFVAFCVRRPDQCAATPGAASVELTAANWDSIKRINDTVNRAIVPQTDWNHYGREEYWTIPTDGYGDCEDYALTKRQSLADAGLPAGALRVAVVLTPQNTLHAVLTVTTDRGDYVLDNLSGEISAADESSYRWIERQDASAPWRWVSLLSDGDRRQIASLGDGALTGGLQ